MERAPEMTECTGEVGGICWRDKRNVLARLMERTGEVGGLFVLLDEFDPVKISMIWDVSNESRLGRSIRTKFSISI